MGGRQMDRTLGPTDTSRNGKGKKRKERKKQEIEKSILLSLNVREESMDFDI